jgi:hypothetical protein
MMVYLENKMSIFLLVLFMCSSKIHSQNDSIKRDKWILSFVYSANHTYRYARQVSVPTVEKYEPSYHTNDQISKYGWHTSILVSRKLIKYLYFQTGIIIDNQGYKTKSLYDTTFNKYHQSIDVETYSYLYNYRFIGFPIKLIGKLNLNKTIFLSMDVGFTYYFIEGGPFKRLGSNSSINNGIGVANQYSINGALGINYAIKKMYLSLKPHFNYFISPLESGYINSPLDQGSYKLNLYSTGIEFGLNYYLGH